MLRLLQISDIHFSPIKEETYDYAQMRTAFLDDVADLCEKKNLDGVLICGDIAFSGKQKEYEIAVSFIDELLRITHCPPERVFIVPGNHDKDRDIYEYTRTVLRKDVLTGDSFNAINHVYDDSLSRLSLYLPFREYAKFAVRYAKVSELMSLVEQNDKIILPDANMSAYWFSPIIDEVSGVRYNFFGLNSTLFSDREDSEHKQFLPKQDYSLITQSKSDVNILLMHHPTSEMINGTALKSDLDARFRIQFYGHLHNQKSGVDGNSIKVYSGAFMPPNMSDTHEEYKPIYNIIEINVKSTSTGRAIDFNILSRIWENDKFIVFDAETKRDSLTWDVNTNWIETLSKNNQTIEQQIMTGDIGYRFINGSHQQEIIHKLVGDIFDQYPDMFAYIKFIKKIQQENRTEELLNLMKEYE